MNRLIAVAVLAIGVFGAAVGPVRAEVTPEQVRKAIDRGVAYLKSQQNDNGAWDDMVYPRGGITALATLALLEAGVDPADEKMQKALACLRKVRPQNTYVVALQTMVFARADPERGKSDIRRNVEWLESTQIHEGPFQGSWSYPGGDGDNSNSQFALLALHEAERVGVVANKRTWDRAQKYWERCQNPDGSWGYKAKGYPGAGSMTCAGITSLVIAMDRAEAADAHVSGDHIECCVARKSGDADRIERGIQWLGQRFSVATNPGTDRSPLYYLYGLERTGRLTARRFLPLMARPGRPARADWYRDGADHLIRQQDPLSGYWTAMGPGENIPVIGTSFALLFLSKGRWPVLLGKLQYGSAESDDWNRHRSDVGNLTRHVETRWKRDLTWQVIDLRLATVEELVQTPVLYLSGSHSPLPDDPTEWKQTAQKIRDYLDRGGFLLAEANCGSTGFDRGFRELMRLVFPEPEYKLQLLEPEHPIWYAEEKVDPRQMRPLWGVEFGCRTSVVYAPPDPLADPRPSLSCLWELSRPGRGHKYSAAVQAQIDAALALGTNVLAYATNRELKPKEEVVFHQADTRGPSDKIERGRLYVATLRHPGGCNVAPRAVVNLMDAAGRELKLRTRVRDELLDISDPRLFDYHLVFMHGRTSFHLTDIERQQLRQYIERGGMLLADSICASRAFTESFRREMAAIFSKHKLERIPTDDPLLSTTYGGSDLRLVSRRDPEATPRGGGPMEAAVRRVPPDLEGIKLADHWGVVFSPFDLSCALERRDSLACRGYTREDAARIGLNVVLYSLQQ
jgi:prenyltransferase beta subunit